MKIKRKVGGLFHYEEFELTPEELRAAYEEKDREYMTEDIRNHIDSGCLDDLPELTDYDLDQIAGIAKHTLNNHDTYWDCYHYTIDEAIETYVKERINNED